MTREERNNKLKQMNKEEIIQGLYRGDSRAIKEAIKILEQEPCEDCISREALYNELYDHFHDEDAPNNITEVRLGTIRNFVKNFPSATPINKTGHWINSQ